MKKIILPLLFIFSFIQISQGQDYSEIIKATASDAAAYDYFGVSVSISGDYAIVGAYGNDDNGSNSGAVYIYKKDQGGTDTWGQVKKLTASDAAAGDYFGFSVFISGDDLIVGAYGNDDNGSNSGAVYIFKKDQGGLNNWGQVKKLTAAAGGSFGWSVSMSGDYAIVGAFGDTDYGSASGAAYIFKKDQGGLNNWGQVKKLNASDAATYHYFGQSVSISGDYAIVGASGNSSAYIFIKDQGGADNWGELKKLTTSDVTYRFGFSVFITGDDLIVGDDGNINNGNNTGAAYIFKKDQGGTGNWGEVKKITASDLGHYDFFGYTVSLSGDYVIIGAPENSDNGSLSGSTYIYARNQGGTDNWGEVKKLNASDGAASDNFGLCVSISGDYAIVGAYGNDDNGSNSGSAYIVKNLGVLPVELTYFNGKKVTTGNQLTWQTASEKNNKGFEIQRSQDDNLDSYRDWETLDFIEGQGTITTTQNYTYLDKNPAKGNNYYRLKQIDLDGKFEYSNIINVNYELGITNDKLSVFPNPVTNKLNIIGGQGQATIYNLLGQPVKQFTINTEQSTINVTDLPNGQYILHIQSREIGRTITTQRFLK